MAVAALALGLSLAVTTGARADDARDQARKLAEQAYDDFEAKRFEDALANFIKAEALFHAPPHKLFIARSRARLGQLSRAKASYEELLLEKLGPKAPKEFVASQQEGREELEALDKSMPRLRIELQGPGAKLVKLRVDDQEVEGLRAEGPIFLDPGPHTVEAVAIAGTDAVGAKRSVELKEGSNQVVKLEIPLQARSWNAPGLLLVSVGVAGLAAGGVMGGLHLARVGELDVACPGGACPVTEQGRLDEAKALGLGSTVALIAGGAVAVAGVVFFLVPPFRAQKPAIFAAPALRVRGAPARGGGGLFVEGAF